MIVTCAQCSKRYMLDDVLVPIDGRQVRCVSCQHIWWQMPEKPASSDLSSFLALPHEGTIEVPSFSRHPFKSVGFIVGLALFFSFLSCLIFGRNIIVATWPASEKAYALFGLPINLPGAGLAISNITSFRQEDSSNTIIVAGDVTNTSNRTRLLPSLKIKIIGNPSLNNPEDRQVLDSWEHQFSETSLLPGEHIHFETAPRPIAEGTQHVAAEF